MTDLVQFKADLLQEFESLDADSRMEIVSDLLDSLYETDRIQFRDWGWDWPEPPKIIPMSAAVKVAYDKYNFIGPHKHD